MRKRFLLLLISTIVALPLVLYGAAPTKDLKVTKIGNKKGPAIYSHPIHEKKGVKECKTCHHQGKQDDPCAKCHKKDPIKGKKALHKNCKGCHKKMGAGPTKCNDCHQKK